MMMIAAAFFLAHSWYPHECCKNEHCYPVQYVRTEKNGDIIVRTEDSHEIGVPKGFPRRNSEDGGYHLCYNKPLLYAEPHILSIYCFFVPGEA